MTSLAFALALIAVAGRTTAPTVCLAPASTQLIGVSGTDASAATVELFKSYLTGPSISVAPLSARLASQAREEAKRANCRYVLFVSLKGDRKSESSGLLGRIAGRAAQDAAWSAGAYATSTVGRVAANAVAAAAGAAASSIATTTKVRDELELSYRLESGAGSVVAESKAKRTASANGEDLLTPLVERAAEDVATAVAK